MSNQNDLRKKLDLKYAAIDREAQKSLSAFVDNYVIECGSGLKQYSEASEWWQRERNQQLIPALEFAAGLRPEYTGPRNFWVGQAKGHDKSSNLARLLNGLLAYAKRPLRMYCGAKDAEQAGVIADIMEKDSLHNPWFKDRITYHKKYAEGVKNGARLDILTSDAGGAQGKIPDVIVCDEICHWTNRDLFDSLFSARDKKPHCVFVILTNAGTLHSWQDGVRRLARESSLWSFYEQPVGVRLASWLDEKSIAENRKLLHPAEAARLLDNRWIDPGEDRGYLLAEDVLACVGVPAQPAPGSRVYLGIDYGGVNDPTALAVLWRDGESGTVHVLSCEVWKGSHAHEIPLAEVDRWVDEKLTEYPGATCVFDKYQLLATIQRLEQKGHRVIRFEYRGGKRNFEMAENLRVLVTGRKIVYGADCGRIGEESLTSEMIQLVTRPMAYGYRFDHIASGHDDRVTAVGMAALQAVTDSTPTSQMAPVTVPDPFKPSPALPLARLGSLDRAQSLNLFGLRR